jgi:HlyD family secretion protein
MKEDPDKLRQAYEGAEGEGYREEYSAAESSRLAQQRRQRRYLIIGASVVVLILIVIVIGIWKWKKASSEQEQAVTPVVSVRVAKAAKEEIAAPVSAVGTIFPREQATVAAKISAQIKRMALLKNKFVKAGEVIAVLESRDLVAQRNEAVAALNQERANERSVNTGTIPQTNAQDQKALRDVEAKVRTASATYERRRLLFEQGGISKKDLEASQLELTTAQNELRLTLQTITLRATALNPNERLLAAARVQAAQQRVATLDAQLSYATIRAPITGVITDQFQYEGEFAAAGAKLFNIADISQVIVKAPFSDTVASKLKVGDVAAVLPTDGSAEELKGQVSLLSRASDPTNRTVEVWVSLANAAGRLRANGAAQITISSQSRDDTIVVPASAVTLESSNANEGTVMVVDDKLIAHETKVTIGLRTPDKMEISEGLKVDDTVVIEGNFSLPDGARIVIAKDEEQKGAGEKSKEEDK